MKATRFEFRYRLWIGFVIYVLGFWAPWLRYGPGASSRVTTTWLELAGGLASIHALTLQAATVVVTSLAILLAAAGAAFRVWGTAYLGAGIVTSGAMHAQTVVAAGPYRHVRNPLYFGSLVFSLAVAILMPPTGAIFFIVALFVQVLRLILAEEAYLLAEQGESYLAYKARVPRLFPSPVARVPRSPATPHWLQAVVAEIFTVGMTGCFAVLAWRYNAQLLTQALIVCFGVSLVVRALAVKQPQTPQKAA
ncbi:MAG TPA: isoprenylcysteine carboxylmethyltransferase family protein [Silvibacterium sp.]|nr:isoprenylcysteine carboxylmethyltransferase family protein [Silvibacterium sp.]